MEDRDPNALRVGRQDELRSRRPIVLAGIGAALLCNYWVLEGLLAERTDLATSWISDIATRSESFGWRFVTLGVISGLAIAGFALLLLRCWDGCSRILRRGLLALLGSGALTVVASAAPLSCPEGLEPSCSLAYDPLDVIHSIATAGEIAATVLAFAFIGVGLLRLGTYRRAGRATLAIGALWLALTALTGLSYLSGDVDSVKGIFQRADQVVFGAWLVLLGVSRAPARRRSRSGAGAPR